MSDTVNEHTIICPHCEHHYENAFEFGDSGSEKCEKCDGVFEFERDVVYSTSIPLSQIRTTEKEDGR